MYPYQLVMTPTYPDCKYSNKQLNYKRLWHYFLLIIGLPVPYYWKANFNTLPTVAVTVGTENVTLELPNHAFRNRSYVGGFYVSLRQAIPAGTTATLPILIGTNGDTRPLLAYNNEPVTVGNLAGTGIYEIHYNKYTNELFLVNGGYRPTTAPAPTPTAEATAQRASS